MNAELKKILLDALDEWKPTHWWAKLVKLWVINAIVKE